MAKLISDIPLMEGAKNSEDDGLDFAKYSLVLSEVAKETEGPFTIGVFGEWGTGKTSLLRLIKKNIDSDENILAVWFNAWRFERSENLLLPLLTSIYNVVEKNTNKKLDKLLDALKAIYEGFSFNYLGVRWIVKDSVQKYNELNNNMSVEKDIYQNAYDLLDKINFNDYKIVIFIDDLDRCNPEAAISLLENIKLILNQPGFLFFLGMSKKLIEKYLSFKYKDKYGMENFSGDEYLEKIIQLPFQIPSHKIRIKRFIQNIIHDKFKECITSSVIEFTIFASHNNPRKVIRFINSLILDHELKPEIDISYFALVRCFYFRWPNFFHFILSHEKIFVDYLIQLDDNQNHELEFNDYKKEIKEFDEVRESDRDFNELTIYISKGFSQQNKEEIIRNLEEATQYLESTINYDGINEIKGENFSDRTLDKASFINKTFFNCNFSRSDLIEADFTESTFTKCNFKDSNIKNGKFVKVKFRDCEFFNSHFLNTNMENVDFEREKIQNSTFTNANLSGSYFSDVYITGSNFVNVKFDDTLLEDALLYNTDFTDSSFYGADFRNAKISTSKFKNSEINKVKNLSKEQIEYLKLQKAILKGNEIDG